MKRWSRTPPHRLVPIDTAPRVVVVGHCAAGKSTLAAELRGAGIDAVTAAQEHSAIPELWRHTGAELLVYLDVDLGTIRQRRDVTWSESIYAAQEARLRSARMAADLIIDTANSSIDEMVDRCRCYVDWWRYLSQGTEFPLESTA